MSIFLFCICLSWCFGFTASEWLFAFVIFSPFVRLVHPLTTSEPPRTLQEITTKIAPYIADEIESNSLYSWLIYLFVRSFVRSLSWLCVPHVFLHQLRKSNAINWIFCTYRAEIELTDALMGDVRSDELLRTLCVLCSAVANDAECEYVP